MPQSTPTEPEATVTTTVDSEVPITKSILQLVPLRFPPPELTLSAPHIQRVCHPPPDHLSRPSRLSQKFTQS